MTELTLTFATNYNGVCLNYTDDDIRPSTEVYKVFDEVADTLPELTYEYADNWEHTLSKKHIKEICKIAKDIVKSVIPDAKITFEYDTYST